MKKGLAIAGLAALALYLINRKPGLTEIPTADLPPSDTQGLNPVSDVLTTIPTQATNSNLTTSNPQLYVPQAAPSTVLNTHTAPTIGVGEKDEFFLFNPDIYPVSVKRNYNNFGA